MAVTLDFYRDPAEFLAAAGDHLAADPVLSTVVANVADRAARESADGVNPPDRDWYVVARDDDVVAGVGMRTASFEPRPLYLLPMPEEAAVLLARTLHERGEEVAAVNGALPATWLFADEAARLLGRRAEVTLHMRLFELREPPPTTNTPGRLRAATRDEIDVVTTWFDAFMNEADEQAGRPRGTTPHETPERPAMLRRLDEERVWLWVDAGERPVHLIGVNPPSFRAARIGPVYTPPEERGRGWAGAAVAEVSRRILAGGARPCLFTDQANPTSNALYQRLGYRPVVDMVNVRVV
ncbi:MAG TPA: GNAT family N-acetyltransferase [Candidatus Binatia bacterium]|nr:GNAT family N-acetyltransferase [Candidatus Binatia bacterium]